MAICPKCRSAWGQKWSGQLVLCRDCRREDMRIPLEMRTLTAAIMRNPEIQSLLIAAVLNSDDDCVIITEKQLLEAEGYKLVVTDVGDEGERAISLTAREK